MKLIKECLFQFLLFSCVIFGCSQPNTVDTENSISRIVQFSKEFKPKSIDLDLSMPDSIKLAFDFLNLQDTSILRKLGNAIDLILLKQCHKQLYSANMEYSLMTDKPSYSKKLLFAFLSNNGIDSNQIIRWRQGGNLAFTTGNVYDVIKKRDVKPNEICNVLAQINIEIKRLKNGSLN